jgi:hypothetical protein
MTTKIDFSENLTSYSQEFEKILDKLETEINSIKISLTPISKKQLKEIDSLMTESENNIKQIEVELSMVPQSTKTKFKAFLDPLLTKLKQQKTTYSNLKSSRNNIKKETTNGDKVN